MILFYGCLSVFSALVFIDRSKFIYFATACKLFLNMTAVFCL